MGYEFLNYVFGVWVLMLLLLTVLVCVWVTVRIRYWWRKGTPARKVRGKAEPYPYLVEYHPRSPFIPNSVTDAECESRYDKDGLQGIIDYISSLRDERRHGEAFMATRWLERKRLNDG